MKKSILIVALFAFSVAGAQTRPAAHAPVKRTASVASSAPESMPDEFEQIDKLALAIPDLETGSTDDIAAYINKHFHGSREKTRAIFIWIATNVRYDLANMFALNFYARREEKIEKILKLRTGTCDNYSTLFDALCARTGVKSYIVTGYTKQNGFTDYIPHAWCAAYVDTAWFLFDPTWGSGYVSNGKFVTRVNNYYFMTRPSALIHSHMPFDYLFQFLYHPVTTEQFYAGKAGETGAAPYFNFIDSLAAYDKQDTLAYDIAAYDRIRKNGVKNSMIFDMLEHLRREIDYQKQNRVVTLYNSALLDYTDGVHGYNQFVQYYNAGFKPEKPDAEIRGMIDSASAKLTVAASKLDRIQDPDPSTTALIGNFRKDMRDLNGHIKEVNVWLDQYFAKSKLGRKAMFAKTTLFGIPIN